MGPPGMPSLGGMLPITGLGAAAALWRTEDRRTSQFSDGKKAIQLQTQEDIRAEGLLELVDGNTMISW